MELRRRGLKGLVVNRHTQFKLAIACSTLILFPALIVTVSVLAEVGTAIMSMAQNNAQPAEIANMAVNELYQGGKLIVAVFVIFGSASIFLSLKLSSHIIGPVHRLENQIKGMIEGNFTNEPPLRKDDYLKGMGELLNQLAARLGQKK